MNRVHYFMPLQATLWWNTKLWQIVSSQWDNTVFFTDGVWHELRRDKDWGRFCVIVLCSFSLQIKTCVHIGQLLPWQNIGISSYISVGFRFGGKGIQCCSFNLFLTLIICNLFKIENVKFSIQIVVTCVLYNLFTPVFILFCTLCIFESVWELHQI